MCLEWQIVHINWYRFVLFLLSNQIKSKTNFHFIVIRSIDSHIWYSYGLHIQIHSTYNVRLVGWLDIECTPQLNNILSKCNITNSLNVPLSLLPCVLPLFVQFLSIFIFTFIFIANLLVHFTARNERNVINADEVMQLIHKQLTNKWLTWWKGRRKNMKINCATNQYPPLHSTIHHLICAELSACCLVLNINDYYERKINNCGYRFDCDNMSCAIRQQW